jgi:hypothetical protein
LLKAGDRFGAILGVVIWLQVQRQPDPEGGLRPHPVAGLLHLAVPAVPPLRGESQPCRAGISIR